MSLSEFQRMALDEPDSKFFMEISMDGFASLLGHLVGDYVVQNDWMAKNKVAPHPGPSPMLDEFDKAYSLNKDKNRGADYLAWLDASTKNGVGHLACFVHCVCYTLSVWLFTFWWMPTWGLAAVFLLHFPIDRFRLAKWWMVNVSGQEEFATGPMAPWSFIVVDNIFHLLTIYGVWVATKLADMNFDNFIARLL